MDDKNNVNLKKKRHWDCETDGYNEPDRTGLKVIKHVFCSFSLFELEETESKRPRI